MAEGDEETKATNPYKPFIKLVAGKPTKTQGKRKFGWEIKFVNNDNPSDEDINELVRLNEKMVEKFGEENEEGGE